MDHILDRVTSLFLVMRTATPIHTQTLGTLIRYQVV